MSVGPVYLVWRIDYDSLENRDWNPEELVGYALTEEAADTAIAALDLAPKIDGYDPLSRPGKYPKFYRQRVGHLPA